MKRLKELLLVCLLIGFCFVAFGCNTVEGMGRDIEKGGEKIQEVAD